MSNSLPVKVDTICVNSHKYRDATRNLVKPFWESGLFYGPTFC